MKQLKLTNRELELVCNLMDGMTNVEIAKSMIISVHTVKSMLESIYCKYEVHNRVQLVIKILSDDTLKNYYLNKKNKL